MPEPIVPQESDYLNNDDYKKAFHDFLIDVTAFNIWKVIHNSNP